MLDGAPWRLIKTAKLYQNCLYTVEKQTLQNSKDKTALRNTFHHHEMLPQTHLDECLQTLTALAKRIDPENAKATNLVAFEMHWGPGVETACIGHYLTSIARVYRGGDTVVMTPLWVYDMIREATQWERGVRDRNSVKTTKGITIQHFTMGEACPVTGNNNVREAGLLWDPYSDGVYKQFSAALNAVKLLK